MVTELKMFKSYAEEADLLERYVRDLFDGKSELKILEAGCGRRWPLNLRGIKFRLTGVDLDEKALKSRQDLNEAILADLRYLDLGSRQFDVIYNSFVLEHVQNAALVLENFHQWLKPGGLLILKLPDLNTVYGVVTKFTPFWFHVAYHKYILRRWNAGKAGFGPYPTYYDRVVSRRGLQEFCITHRFAINDEYGLCDYELEKKFATRLVRIIAMMIGTLSLGKLPWKHNNLTYVLKKE